MTRVRGCLWEHEGRADDIPLISKHPKVAALRDSLWINRQWLLQVVSNLLQGLRKLRSYASLPN